MPCAVPVAAQVFLARLADGLETSAVLRHLSRLLMRVLREQAVLCDTFQVCMAVRVGVCA